MKDRSKEGRYWIAGGVVWFLLGFLFIPRSVSSPQPDFRELVPFWGLGISLGAAIYVYRYLKETQRLRELEENRQAPFLAIEYGHADFIPGLESWQRLTPDQRQHLPHAWHAVVNIVNLGGGPAVNVRLEWNGCSPSAVTPASHHRTFIGAIGPGGAIEICHDDPFAGSGLGGDVTVTCQLPTRPGYVYLKSVWTRDKSQPSGFRLQTHETRLDAAAKTGGAEAPRAHACDPVTQPSEGAAEPKA